MNYESYMLRACELGRMAQHIAGDNPFVGCVIYKDGQIIGEGSTHQPGGPHAEVAAIALAISNGFSPANSILFTTVEPCSFYGRTPSCAKSILQYGISKVVIGIRDPHPKVNGAGISILRDAGIEVVEGVCEVRVREYLQNWLNGFQSAQE
jgi:diaminohydroxyphosphoribosylaminopyrimidine deaminase/5-amino-6-(5-phosphoribosylamino)uracil reductase